MNSNLGVLTAAVALPQGDAQSITYATQFWDETESLVKEAEQINRAMIVPAISELRYGGRKLIDYLSALDRGDEKSQHSHLEDFVQCCIRARHDAVDAIISYITLYLEELEATVDADLIGEVFLEYQSFKRRLFDCAKLIAESRRDRQERNHIYSDIRSEYIAGLITDYRSLVEGRGRLFAAQHDRDGKQHHAAWAMAFAVASLAASILIASLRYFI